MCVQWVVSSWTLSCTHPVQISKSQGLVRGTEFICHQNDWQKTMRQKQGLMEFGLNPQKCTARQRKNERLLTAPQCHFFYRHWNETRAACRCISCFLWVCVRRSDTSKPTPTYQQGRGRGNWEGKKVWEEPRSNRKDEAVGQERWHAVKVVLVGTFDLQLSLKLHSRQTAVLVKKARTKAGLVFILGRAAKENKLYLLCRYSISLHSGHWNHL